MLAVWHQPRFSSGTSHGNDATVTPFWNALQQYNADLILGGHVHNYERFAPQRADGAADATGPRQFIVGTGGRSLGGLSSTAAANSEIAYNRAFGVLRLTLRPSGYDWRFVAEPGHTFTDAGSAGCR